MFAVYVDTNEPNGTTNALRFETADAAEEYARDLYSRWFAVRSWYVIQGTEPFDTRRPVAWLAEHCTRYGGDGSA